MADYCGPSCYEPGGHHGPPLPRQKTPQDYEIEELKSEVADLKDDIRRLNERLK